MAKGQPTSAPNPMASGGNPMAQHMPKRGPFKTFRANYRVTKLGDPKLPWVLWGTFFLAGLIGFGLIWLLPGDGIYFPIVMGVFIGSLAVLVVLARRGQRSMYKQIEGTPAAAARALQLLRRGWKVEAPVAVNRQQDLVHRVVGPPGVVLVGEGNPGSTRQLLAQEKKKHERVLAEIPVRTVLVGNGADEVPLPKLTRHIIKLGRKDLKPGEMTEVLARLKALDAQGRNMPIPKGPMPTSMKGQRGNLRGK